jgi:hypothetical protein
VGGAVFPVSVTVPNREYVPQLPVWFIVVPLANCGIVPVTVSADALEAQAA